jgi:hypothetical protein
VKLVMNVKIMSILRLVFSFSRNQVVENVAFEMLLHAYGV